MATNYPSSLDTFDTIASDKKTSDSVGGRTHRDMHNDLADSVEAVQAELGTAPSGDYSTVKARLDALVAYAAKTSAYTATSADRTLNVTSGTFTLDLPAASGLTGWTLRVKNSGTGVVTLDGNSSETVEGVATFPLGAGSYVEITSTGAAWILTGGLPNTGQRNLAAESLSNGWTVNFSQFRLQRIGSLVYLNYRADKTSATADEIYTLPSGFRPSVGHYYVNSAALNDDFVVQYVTSGGVITATRSQAATSVVYGSTVWPTLDAWPTSLLGAAL